jgi:predicted site-specific integrase-resolvase
MLEMYRSAKGWVFSVTKDLGTVFSARLYGSRSHKNKQLLANLQNAVANV